MYNGVILYAPLLPVPGRNIEQTLPGCPALLIADGLCSCVSIILLRGAGVALFLAFMCFFVLLSDAAHLVRNLLARTAGLASRSRSFGRLFVLQFNFLLAARTTSCTSFCSGVL